MSPSILNPVSALGVARPGLGVGGLCLNMIVRNEAPVIARCLASVRPWISRWCILDTGSVDGTQDIIRESLAGVPGALHEAQWSDFATARNQAMDLAHALDGWDHLLVIDADEVLHGWSVLPSAVFDVALADVRSQGRTAHRVCLIRRGYPGRWVGAIHEDLEAKGTWIGLRGPWIESLDDGARARDPQRANKDLAVLFGEIQKDPKNPRNYFYLGQTYRAAGDLEQAEKAFTLRLKFEGDPEERAIARGCLFQLRSTR